MDCRVTETKRYRITYVYREGYHDAVDIVDYDGKQSLLCNITAHSAGQVVEVVSNVKGTTGSGLGNYIRISHVNGYETLYAHIAYNTIKVKKFDMVKEGQVIGYMGATGGAHGGHLHFEVRKDGKKIDPTKYLTEAFPVPTDEFKVGDLVYFKGGKHYTSANDTTGYAARAGEAKIFAIAKNFKHPYSLIRTEDSSSTVYGWVDAGTFVKEIVEPKLLDLGSKVKLKDECLQDINGTYLDKNALNSYDLVVQKIIGDNVYIKRKLHFWTECIVKKSDLIVL